MGDLLGAAMRTLHRSALGEAGVYVATPGGPAIPVHFLRGHNDPTIDLTEGPGIRHPATRVDLLLTEIGALPTTAATLTAYGVTMAIRDVQEDEHRTTARCDVYPPVPPRS